MNPMSRTFFGTDGIRGKVGQAPITPEFFMKLAQAVGVQLLGQSAQATVVIGKDTRNSGYMLESALEAGFNSVGVDVVLLGPIPTPAVAHLTRAIRADLGVVISASHNAYEDNGIKFFSSKGHKLDDAWELQIEALLQQAIPGVSTQRIGKTRRLNDAAGRYIEFCKSTFPSGLDLKGLHVVVDAAHGAAYQVAPTLMHELGAKVTVLGHQPDGLNINANCGATHPETMAHEVVRVGADLGLALDGDADRLIMCDGMGQIRNGDALLYAIAKHLKLAQHDATPGVVGTLMSNYGLEMALSRLGYGLERAKVGDRYVLERLNELGWTLGGESSGHILCLNQHTTGDGLISALQVLAALADQGVGLNDWLSDLALLPQTLVNVRLSSGVDWQNHAGFQREQAQVNQRLSGQGRMLIRPSGTEPLLRIMVEHADEALARESAQALADALSP